jgi:hypothetical protein
MPALEDTPGRSGVTNGWDQPIGRTSQLRADPAAASTAMGEADATGSIAPGRGTISVACISEADAVPRCRDGGR